MTKINQINHFIKTIISRFSFYIQPKDKAKTRFERTQKRRAANSRKLPKQILKYYKKSQDAELLNLAKYVAENGVHMVPYEFRLNYRPESITVYFDETVKYPYVIVIPNRIYFPNDFKEIEIQNAVACALMEQDEKSPHRYQMPSILNANEVAILAGASDGIFCFEIIDKVKKVFLFEADERWMIPLNYTFKDFKDKVEIVQKFISSYDKEDTITLDTFFSKRNERVGYIQADIEGSEKDLLLGADKLLKSNKNMKLSICCYHKQEDQNNLAEILSKYSFKIHYSPGYLLMWMQISLKKPFFRKGVLYT